MAAAPSIACTTSQLNPHLSSVQRKKKASSSESSTRRTNGRERLLGMKRYGADEFVLGDSATRFFGAGGRRVERVTFRSFPRGISHQSVTWLGWRRNSEPESQKAERNFCSRKPSSRPRNPCSWLPRFPA